MIPVMEVNSFLTGKRGVSLPFTDHCEPIAPNEACFSSMFDEILRYGRTAGWKSLEIRGGAEHFNGIVPYRTYVRHVLSLHDREAELFRRLNSATRRNIRTAEKSELQVTLSSSEKDLDEYYRLHCLTRKRHGVPPQPRSFFKAIHGNVIQKGKGFVVLAALQGQPVSGSVYFHSGRKAIYKFGASDLRYQHLRPANLVMWEALRWFSKNGFNEICFGRTDLESAGLIHFKDGWSTRKEPLNYYRYDLKRSAFAKGSTEMNRVSERIFRGSPVPLLRFAGELLYRHVG